MTSKIAIFSPAALDKIVKDTIPMIVDSSHTHAIIAGLDKDGCQVLAHFQVDAHGNWVLDADTIVRHVWAGDTQVGAHVVLKW
jgi:hypothetical protein